MARTSTAFVLLLAAVAGSGVAAAGPAEVVVAPGTVVRWPGTALLECRLGERRWRPFDDACYYPVELGASGELELVRRSTGGVASRRVRVGPYPYPEQRLEVEDRYVAPSAAELERIEREKRRVARLWSLESERRFALPLEAPLADLPAAARFGARRIFNGQPRSPHSGADFAAPTGTPVIAVADGRVVLAEEHFFAGRSVFVDHGDGLVSMSFHLSEIAVTEGDEVRRGQRLGAVGATGRVTGPHLHFAVRWHGARIDPSLLLGGAAMTEIE